MSRREEPEPIRGVEAGGDERAAPVEDEPRSTPAVPIAPHPASDAIWRAPVFDLADRVNVIWHSSRVDDVNQVFASRWDSADPDTTLPTSTVPQQVTVGPAAHQSPAALVLPRGDLLIAYETAQEDIYFKLAPFERLATAIEQPVVTSVQNRAMFPFVVRSGTHIAFFWLSAHRGVDPRPRWIVRVREYTPTWTEAEATWGMTGQFSSAGAHLGSGGVSAFHAAVDKAGEIWAAFQTELDMIQTVHFNPVTGQTTQWPLHMPPGTSTSSRNPAVVVDGDLAVWVLWDAGQRIFSQRFRRDLDPPQWEANPTPVPGAATGSDACPAAVCDAAGVIWLFWSRSRPDPDPPPDSPGRELLDLYLARHHPVTGWGKPLRVSASPFSGFRPIPVLAPDGRIWLFWSGAIDVDGQSDLFCKQLLTST